MPSATELPHAELLGGSVGSTSSFVQPQPTQQGIADIRELYYAKFQRKISEDEAREILSHLFALILNTHLIMQGCSDTDSTPESLGTTAS